MNTPDSRIRGDILQTNRNEDDFVNEYGSIQVFLAEVSWDKDFGRWIATEFPNHDHEIYQLYDYDYDEIIDNIHENPELLG